MARRNRRYAYGPYVDGPDPLAPPFDLRAALDEIGRDVMEGASPRSALQELLRRGIGRAPRPGRADPRGLAAAQPTAAGEPARRHAAAGPRAAAASPGRRARRAGPRRTPTTPGSGRCSSTRCPSDTGGAVRELDDYDWQSSDAREAYEEIRDLLGREMLDQRFAGHEAGDGERHARRTSSGSGRCSTTSTSCSPTTRPGRTPPSSSSSSWQQHGEFFPENPQNTEELIDLLAQRAAAAQRMLNSMTRRAAGRADGAVPAGVRRPAAGAGARPAGRPAAGPAARRGLGRSRAASAATTRWAWARPPARWSSSGSSTRWPSSSSQSYPGARMEDIDLDALGEHLGDQARVDARALAELERELQRQGLFERAPDGSLQLSPKALRRLGRVGAARRRRPDRRAGAASGRPAAPAPAGEATGATRPWAFGDTEAWSVPRTLLNAQLRRAGGDDRALDVTDVEIVETEQRTRAAVALCVDTSWSMVQDGRWVPMKRTALALHQLISTRFRGDDLKLITFGRHARSVELGRAGRPGRACGSRAPTCTTRCCWPGEHLRRNSGRAAGRPRRHRRRADRAPGARRRGGVRLAAEPGDAAGHVGRGGPDHRPARRRSRSSCSATTRGWRPSSTTWPGAAAAGSWPRRWTGWAPRWWPTTCAPAAADARSGGATCVWAHYGLCPIPVRSRRVACAFTGKRPVQEPLHRSDGGAVQPFRYGS